MSEVKQTLNHGIRKEKKKKVKERNTVIKKYMKIIKERGS